MIPEIPDYYIGFNRADGINKGTLEDRDMVTITTKEQKKVRIP
jgi:hypothetical protein